MSLKDNNQVEIGTISRANDKIKVIRNNEDIELSVGDKLYENDIVHNNDYDVFMDFYNGKEFFLESNQEVLLDDYFLPVDKATVIDKEDENSTDINSIQTDAIQNRPHPYYVKSHDEKDTFLKHDEQMVDINAKVANATPNNSDNGLEDKDDNLARDTYTKATVDITDANADNIINANEAQTTLIRGTLEVGGSLESLVITDSNAKILNVNPALVKIDTHGHWSHVVDVKHLADGHLNVEVHTKDAAGNKAVATDSIDKDTIVITKDDTATAIEDQGPIATSGNILTNDDQGLKVTSVGDIKGAYGTYHLQENGDYTYKLDNTNPAVQSLAQGASLGVDSIVYTVTDTAGNRASATLATTITGTNDNPVLSVSQTTNTSGTLIESDVDRGDTHTFETTNGSGHFGTLAVDSKTGVYTYTQNPSVAGMNYDKATGVYSAKEVFAVDVKDNHGGIDTKYIIMDVTAMVTAPTTPGGQPLITTAVTTQPTVTTTQPLVSITNTTPPTNAVTIDLISTSDSGTSNTDNITNDKTPTIKGHTGIPFSKVEILDNGKVIATTTSDAKGHYSVDTSALSDARHSLTAQATAPSVTTSVTSPKIDVLVDTTINAMDDKDTTNEDAVKAISGNVIINDDHSDGETVKATSTLTTAHGVYTLNADGSYTFTVDNTASQSLNAGQSEIDTLTYEITDKAGNTTTATLTTTITGSNDGAVITQSPIDVKEDTNQTATIALGITDADRGEDHFKVGTLTGAHGTATLAQDGTLVYTLDNKATQHLNINETITDIIKVTSADGTTHDVSVAINGTNDKPSINAITAQSVNEDGSKVTGTIVATDVDTGDKSTFATTLTQSGFILKSDGTYTLDPTDASFQGLAVGKKQVITVPIIATDSHGGISSTQNLILSVVGTNDVPKVSAPVTLPLGTEDHRMTFSQSQLLEHATDVDHTDTLKAINISVNHGYAMTDSAGQLNYIPDANFNGKVIFSYDVVDSHGGIVKQTATTTLAAVNDAAHITGLDASVTEDHNPTTSPLTFDGSKINNALEVGGKLTVTDVDGKQEEHFQEEHIKTAHGEFFILKSGYWDYAADNSQKAIQALGVGEHLTDTITVKSADGTRHDIHVTINGTNDIPVLSVNQATHTSGTLSETDVDATDTHVFSAVTTTGHYGTFSVDSSTGAYTYKPNHAVTGMNYDATTGKFTGQDAFEVKVDDGHGGVVSKFITFNSEATLTSQTHTVTTPQNSLTYGSTVAIPNVPPVIAVSVPTPAIVTLTQPNLAQPNTGAANNVHIDLSATSDTGSSHTDKVTSDTTPEITGWTDVPFSKVEIMDGNKVIATAYSNAHQQFTVSTLGLSDGVHALIAKATAPTASTSVSSSPLALTIDTQLVTHNDGQTVHEDATQAITGNVLKNDDHTHGELVTSITQHATGTYGTYSINKDGSYSYTLDNTNQDIQHLPKGHHLFEKITYDVIDPAGNVAHNQIVIRIEGANDGAVIAGQDTGAVTEDTTLQVTGKLDVMDVDTGEDHFNLRNVQHQRYNGALGHITLSADGHWTYHLHNHNNLVQQLAEGETKQDTIKIVSHDGTVHSIVIDVHGTNDKPTLTGRGSYSVVEDSKVNGLVTEHDTDRTDTHQYALKTPVDGMYINNMTGKWTFDASHPAYQHLQIGQTEVVQAVVQAVDNHGGIGEKIISITVKGTNDAPNVADVNMTTNEDKSLLFTNTQLLANSGDVEGDHIYIANVKVDAQYGRIVDHGMGNYEFIPKHNVNLHNFGDKSVPITFDVGDGRATSSGTAHVMINPTNDRPVVGVVDLGHINEDTAKVFTEADLLSKSRDIDVDASGKHLDTLYAQNIHVNPNIGTIVHTAQGYIFTPNPNWNGNNLHIDFDVVDGRGGTTSGHALLDVKAMPDPSLITQSTQNQDLGVKEDDKTNDTAHGKLDISDPDIGDNAFRANSSIAGKYGMLRITADGHWTYKLNNATSAVQELSEGHHVLDALEIVAKDGTKFMLNIDVAGTNDKPSITSVGSISTVEDGSVVHGKIVAHDVDVGDPITYALKTPVDGLMLNAAAGDYSFDPKSAAYQGLKEGEVKHITADIIVHDSHGAQDTRQLSIVVTGKNDTPVVKDVTLSAIDEDHSITFAAKDLLANTTDLDHDVLSVASVALKDSTIGTIKADGHGNYIFTPHHNYNAQDVKLDFTVTDGKVTQSGVAHIDVNPVNDAPTLHNFHLSNATKAITFTEADLLKGSGATDVDKDTLHVVGVSTNIDPKVGQIVDHGNGTYTFIPTSHTNSWASQHPNANFHAKQNHGGSSNPLASINIPIHFGVTDGHSPAVGGTATLSYNPSHNNTPNTIITPHVSAATEESHATATGTIGVSDPDGTQFNHLHAISSEKGTYGNFSVDTNGKWTYYLDNSATNVQALKDGQTVHDKFIVTSLDGTTKEISIPIHGTDDKPIIKAITQTQTTEETMLNAHGQLSITDADHGESAFKATNYISATNGHLQIDAQGNWIYHLNNNNPTVQALGSGEHLKDTVVVESVDGTKHTISITVNGTNDIPVISNIATQSAIEGGATLSGSILATDVDTSDKTHLVFSTTTTAAGFTINPDGSYTFDPSNAAYSGLQAHQTKLLDIPISVTDGHGGTATQMLQISITGTNSAPTADAHVDLGATKEDISKTFSEQGLISLAHGTDLDKDTLHVANMHVDPKIGSIHDDGKGNFSFVPVANQHQDNVPITYQITDGQKFVTVTAVLDVTSVNDKPVVNSFSLGTIDEDTSKHFTTQDLLKHASDVDTQTDTPKDSLSLHGIPTVDAKYGTITDDGNGKWTFTPKANFHQNAIPIRFEVIDSHGAVSGADAKINVKSIADPAVITDIKSDHAVEDSKLTAHGEVKVTDKDGHSQEHMQANSYIAGHFGHLEINSAGKWTYQLDQNHKVQYLAAGEVYTENFIVKSADGTTHPIHVDIQGTNDIGSISGKATATILENTATATGTLAVHDIDTLEKHLVANANMPGTYGHLEVMSNGQWVYHLDANAKVETLYAGETHTETFTVKTPEGITQDVVVIVKGTNDAPTITGHAVLTHSNEDTKVTISEHDLLQNAHDVDNTDLLSAHNITADHGTVKADGHGGFTYTPKANFNGIETFHYEVHDNHGGTVETTMTKEIDPVFDVGTVTVDKVTPDNIINAVESQGHVTVSGTATGGDISTGDKVSFTINGTTYSATVGANGVWSASVAGADLVAQKTFSVNVASTDGSASGTSTTSHTVNVDTQIDASVTINDITSDNVINASESGALVAVTGTVGGDVKDGDKVILHVNGTDVNGIVHNGAFTINVQGSDLAKATDISASVTATDTAGNAKTATASHNYTADTTLVAKDDVSIIDEDTKSISGNVLTNDDKGSTLTTVGDIHAKFGTYHLSADGSFTYTLNSTKAQQHLSATDSKHDQVSYTIKDAAGNTATAILSTTIQGTNDKPVIDTTSSVVLGKVHEDAVANIVMGHLAISDIDTGDTHTITVDPSHDAQYGTLTMHGDRWEYALDNTNQHVNDLFTGDKLIDTIQVNIDDGHGGITSQEIKIEIDGHSITAPSLSAGMVQVQADEPLDNVLQDNIDMADALAHQVSVVDEVSIGMPSLDDIEYHLEVAKTTTIAEVPHEDLATVATLLEDATEQEQSRKIIQAVEQHDTKEPVKNPEVASPDTSTADTDESMDTVHNAAEHVEYVPDVHNQMLDDMQEHDGTGLTN